MEESPIWSIVVTFNPFASDGQGNKLKEMLTYLYQVLIHEEERSNACINLAMYVAECPFVITQTGCLPLCNVISEANFV